MLDNPLPSRRRFCVFWESAEPGLFALNYIYTQTIPALITNHGGDGTFQLLVEPAGAATLSQTSVILAAGASTEVMITPQVVSSAPNDVQIVAMQNDTTVGRDEMTIVSVAMPQAIRDEDTPAAMPDRIPPRVNTPIHVGVIPDLAGSGQFVTLAINNQNAPYATVTLNGAATVNLTSSGDVNIQSLIQTVGSNALRATLRVRDQDTIMSNGFGVAAIPINFRQIDVQQPFVGVLRFFYAWDSDSHVLEDLDLIWIGEYVTYSDGGIHVGTGRPWQENNWDPTITPARAPGLAMRGFLVDTHYVARSGKMPTAGPADQYWAFQCYGFHDFRTDNRPPDNTLGWQINLLPTIEIGRFVENVGTAEDPIWRYRITKSGETAVAPWADGSASQC